MKRTGVIAVLTAAIGVVALIWIWAFSEPRQKPLASEQYPQYGYTMLSPSDRDSASAYFLFRIRMKDGSVFYCEGTHVVADGTGMLQVKNYKTNTSNLTVPYDEVKSFDRQKRTQ